LTRKPLRVLPYLSHNMLHHASTHTDALRIHRKISFYNYAVVFFAAVGSIIYGYDSSVIATTLVSQQRGAASFFCSSFS
jgi:MFS family permease